MISVISFHFVHNKFIRDPALFVEAHRFLHQSVTSWCLTDDMIVKLFAVSKIVQASIRVKIAFFGEVGSIAVEWKVNIFRLHLFSWENRNGSKKCWRPQTLTIPCMLNESIWLHLGGHTQFYCWSNSYFDDTMNSWKTIFFPLYFLTCKNQHSLMRFCR